MIDHRPLLRDLLREEALDAEALIGALVSGELSEGASAGLLTALQARGVDGDELASLARALSARAVAVPAVGGPLLDTCGTGGSGLDTANTSTVAALVLAGLGVRVAKHGNRASSGRCGSADLLDALGVPLATAPEAVGEVLDRAGMVFLFAPAFHPAVRHVGPARRALGVPTVFNLLGPLCNPARPDVQVLGVSRPEHGPLMAAALAALGRRAVVVHGEDGLDEVTLCGPTRTWTVSDAAVVEGRITPEDLGLPTRRPEELRGGDVTTNVAVARSVLAGAPGPHTDLVLANVALALGGDLRDGVARAREGLTGGARVLRALAGGDDAGAA
ncbi:MAG: anthranilate phosphoribosyltransferase [Alphaproteobacteria bacterium]|nr:anthranilate phosphoribosyltransferase [Alphaproteobacteria bacterium]MCB9698553.1 anthranilate phosphoribosyltransferase [Alphaproteobacteria bacterium]